MPKKQDPADIAANEEDRLAELVSDIINSAVDELSELSDVAIAKLCRAASASGALPHEITALLVSSSVRLARAEGGKLSEDDEEAADSAMADLRFDVDEGEEDDGGSGDTR